MTLCERCAHRICRACGEPIEVMAFLDDDACSADCAKALDLEDAS